MTREEKSEVIADLKAQLSEGRTFYLADIGGLTVENNGKLRRSCFKGEVSLEVIKNTLLKKAMEQVEGTDYTPLYDLLKGSTSIMFTDTANTPARIIKDFRKKHDKPVLKGAFVQEECYIGDDQLEALATIKSKDELIGDVIGLLQSPMTNLVSALNSGQNTLSGLVKTLSEKGE